MYYLWFLLVCVLNDYDQDNKVGGQTKTLLVSGKDCIDGGFVMYEE